MSKPVGTWWFSQDGKRGFSWASIVGYDYKPGGRMGYATSVLYMYTSVGILNLSGAEADSVYEEARKRIKGV